MGARIVTVAAAILVLSACAEPEPAVQPADLVLLNGAIYTLQPSAPWAEALAIRDGRIVAVGGNAEVERYRSTATEVVDLDGNMVMPGIVDAHVHPIRGAAKNLFECNFPFTATPEEVRAAVAQCVEDQPDAQWIIGGQWDSGFFERFDIASPRELLDAVSAGKAVVLRDDSLHNLWVNSRALELAGVTDSTEDPAGGRFVRDAAGRVNGVVLETAAKDLYAVVPEYSSARLATAAVEYARIANAYGITGAKGAATYESELAGLYAADEAGQLSVHMAISIRGSDRVRTEPLDYAELERIRSQYASDHLNTSFVKFFLDGVPTPARTAAMLAPYVPDDVHEEGFDGGDTLIPVDLLTQDLTELDRRGFTVKMHAAGDRAVRVGLDAIEATRETNGNRTLMHELAHAGYIAPVDIPRFASLNAVADLSPIIWHPSPIIDSILLSLGHERGVEYWPVRDLLDSGAFVIAGSDWPAAVPDANPWVGVEALVTRSDPREQTPGTLWPEQAITLEEALVIYTVNGAQALGLAARTGSLEVGKSADLIVLDRNLFQVPITEVGDTQVLQTYFEGERVYSAE